MRKQPLFVAWLVSWKRRVLQEQFCIKVTPYLNLAYIRKGIGYVNDKNDVFDNFK